MRLAEAGLNQRLADRLAGGLAAPIERGGETLRLEVIKKRRDRTDMECLVSDEACAFIARHFPQSMRAAIGALKQIVLVYGSSGLTVGVEEARRALKTHLLDATRRVTLDDLLDAVAEEFELKPDDLTGRAQPQRIVRARHAFVMIGRDSLKESFPKLARALRRDHTTAMNSYEKAYIHYERLEAYREHIARIEAALNLPPPDRSGGPQKLR